MIRSTHNAALSTTHNRRGGYVMIWGMTVLVVMIGVGTLAVDWGHVQLAKTQLMTAADASARAGCAGLAQSPAEEHR
jgi:Flp pilus assembly protein TadG